MAQAVTYLRLSDIEASTVVPALSGVRRVEAVRFYKNEDRSHLGISLRVGPYHHVTVERRFTNNDALAVVDALITEALGKIAAINARLDLAQGMAGE